MLNLFSSQLPPAAKLPRVDILIGRGVAQQRVRTVTPPVFVIGTHKDCDLVLTDSQFAEYHAYIMVSADRVMLRLLAESPEITVNGRISRWSELQHDDRLRMGPYEFHLRIWPVGQAQIGDLLEAERGNDQQMGDYDPPPALAWTNPHGLDALPDAWTHVVPAANRLSDW